MNVLRYANRVPLQFQSAACAVTQTILATNWRSYGLSQSRGSLPSGPVTAMVHVASVWVPFTSESKEAIASYPEIQKEIRLALQAVGRKLGMYMRRRAPRGPGGAAAEHLPSLPRRGRHGGRGDQRRRPREALRAAPRRGQEEDGRGRREARRPGPADSRRRRISNSATTASSCRRPCLAWATPPASRPRSRRARRRAGGPSRSRSSTRPRHPTTLQPARRPARRPAERPAGTRLRRPPRPRPAHGKPPRRRPRSAAASRLWNKSAAARSGDRRPWKPSAFPAVDHVEKGHG